jgi:hypothetical protein
MMHVLLIVLENMYVVVTVLRPQCVLNKNPASSRKEYCNSGE